MRPAASAHRFQPALEHCPGCTVRLELLQWLRAAAGRRPSPRREPSPASRRPRTSLQVNDGAPRQHHGGCADVLELADVPGQSYGSGRRGRSRDPRTSRFTRAPACARGLDHAGCPHALAEGGTWNRHTFQPDSRDPPETRRAAHRVSGGSCSCARSALDLAPGRTAAQPLDLRAPAALHSFAGDEAIVPSRRDTVPAVAGSKRPSLRVVRAVNAPLLVAESSTRSACPGFPPRLIADRSLAARPLRA